MTLIPYRIGRDLENGGTFWHSFAPEGLPLQELVRPGYMLCMETLLPKLGLPIIWADAADPMPLRKGAVTTALMVPDWLVDGIRSFMACLSHAEADEASTEALVVFLLRTCMRRPLDE